MQRHPVELGAFHDQYFGRQLVLENAVAAFCAYRVRYSARHFTKRISHSGDRPSLRERRPANDSQSYPPSRWPSLFRPFAYSISCGVMVAAQGGRPNPTTEITLATYH